jgi:hypothetical protein
MVSAMYVYCFSIIMDIAFFTICIQQKTGGTGARQAVSFGTYSWLGATNMAAGPNIMELERCPLLRAGHHSIGAASRQSY